MTYLKIINDGLIEIEDLTLIGSSTKRGVEGKIGEFGSGNKFSLAWYFRNDCKPIIFRGLEQMEIDTKVVLHRDTPVQVITVGGIDTSITTNMGPKWDGWMALRETVSNAIDEGGFSMKTVYNPDMKGEDNKTIYYIPMNSELDKVVSNFNHYFSMDRTVLFENSKGQVFERAGDAFNLYRQGIRCYDDNKKINVDVNLYNLEINESRLTCESAMDRSMKEFILEGVPKHVMHLLLSSEYKDIIPKRFSEHNLEVIKDMVADGKTFGSDTMAKLAGLLGTSTYDYVVSSYLYDQLITEKIIDGIKSTDQKDFVVVEDHVKLGEVKYFLGAFGITNPIQNVMTDKFNVATWYDGTILVNVNSMKENSCYENIEIAHVIVRTMPLSDFKIRVQ